MCFAFFSYRVDTTMCLTVLARVARYFVVHFIHHFVLLEIKVRFAYAFAITFLGIGRVPVTCVCKTDIASEFTFVTQDCFICFITITQVCRTKES